MEERRKYVRSEGLILIDYKEQQISGKSSAFDASGAGVRITIEQQLKVGTAIDMRIYLPGSTQPIKASGKVAWVAKCSQEAEPNLEAKKQYFYTGIGFTMIDEDSKKKIAEHVFRKLHQE